MITSAVICSSVEFQGRLKELTLEFIHVFGDIYCKTEKGLESKTTTAQTSSTHIGIGTCLFMKRIDEKIHINIIFWFGFLICFRFI